jgi:hypothetical protein
MDDLREAAQQALEVLESWSGMRSLWDAEDQKALDTLRAALERPEPLYAAPQPCPTCEALARAVMMDQTGRG